MNTVLLHQCSYTRKYVWCQNEPSMHMKLGYIDIKISLSIVIWHIWYIQYIQIVLNAPDKLIIVINITNYRLGIMHHANNCGLHFGMAANVEYYCLLSLIGLFQIFPLLPAIIAVCFRQCHLMVTAQQAVTSAPFWLWFLLIPVRIQMTLIGRNINNLVI